MPYDDANTRRDWSWRNYLPPVPSFSFFGDPYQQATVGVQDTPLPVGSFGGADKPQIALPLANSVSPLPATTTGATGPVTPLQPLKDPLAEPAKGPGYNPAITAPGAKPGETVMPSGVPLAGFARTGENPEKTFNQKLLELAKNGNFTGALAALSGAGGPKATSGTAPSPHPFQVGQMQQLTKPRDILNKAESLLQAATAKGAMDLTGAIKRKAGEQDRYSILNKRTQQDALKGLLG